MPHRFDGRSGVYGCMVVCSIGVCGCIVGCSIVVCGCTVYGSIWWCKDVWLYG